jgi:hypothetical protein
MTVSLKELKHDIASAEEHGAGIDSEPVYFLDEGGDLLPVGDVVWDDDNDCWVICYGEDDDD